VIKKKLILDKCEIDDCEVRECLHLHHVIERTEINTCNDSLNLCILCPTHHALAHDGKLKIIGIFPSTKLPNGRTVIYELNGQRNIEGIDHPYIKFENKKYKLYHGDNNE